MGTLTIKNMPEDLYMRLKQTAARHRRSLSTEAIECLEKGLHDTGIASTDILSEARKLRKKTAHHMLTDEMLCNAKKEGRP